MKFSDLYQEAISMWPTYIDISDGYPTGTSGYLFPNLTRIHDEIESSIAIENNWMQVMDWTLFQSFHSESKTLHKNGELTLNPRKVEIEEVEKRLMENLDSEGWEEQLKEYVNDI